MANPLRGEVEVELGGKKRKARLTLQSIIEIEDELDKGLVEVMGEVAEGRVKVRPMIAILKRALADGGEAVSDAELDGIAREDGVYGVLLAVQAVVIATLNVDEGKAQPKKRPARKR